MTAIFCEPELLKDCEIAKTIEETTFPFFEINEFEDVKRAESREPRLRDMHLLFVIEDFEGDLFKGKCKLILLATNALFSIAKGAETS